MRPGAVAVAAMALLVTVGSAGCGNASTSPGTVGTPTVASSSNERILTRAQSLELVSWAQTYRRCMLEHGTHLGPLVTTQTQLSMALPEGVVGADVVPASLRCGDKQGGPPQKSSVQYRPGEILVYLPKQCLLDPKVART